jgi:hypothetical protein
LAVTGRIRWVADEAVAPGGVKVLTRRGQVDATIQTQLDNVAEALLGARTGPGPAAPEPAAGEGEYLPEAPEQAAQAKPDKEPAPRGVEE